METSSVLQSISSLSLSNLKETFGLPRDRTDPFFEQWLLNAASLTDFEQQALDRLKCNYEKIMKI